MRLSTYKLWRTRFRNARESLLHALSLTLLNEDTDRTLPETLLLPFDIQIYARNSAKNLNTAWEEGALGGEGGAQCALCHTRISMSHINILHARINAPL